MAYVDADYHGWRDLAVHVLLQGYVERDEKFIRGRRAKMWAELLGLPEWPPRQRYSMGDLTRRARVEEREWDGAGPIGRIRSRNPADSGPEVWRQGPAVVGLKEWDYA